MKQSKLYIVILLSVLIIPSIAYASWWDPFTWDWNILNIFNKVQIVVPIQVQKSHPAALEKQAPTQSKIQQPFLKKSSIIKPSSTPTKIIPSSPTSTSVTNPAITVAPTPQPLLINGKTVVQRLQEASDRLHTAGSGQQVQSDFPDLQLVYTDNADNTGFPSEILPFKYYYSQEADRTFSVCGIDWTVFICTGKLDRLITKSDISSGRCVATSVYTSGDPRLNGY